MEEINTVSAEVWPMYVIHRFWMIQNSHTLVGWNANLRGGGANLLLDKMFAENCMEIKEIGPGFVPRAPLDPQMYSNCMDS